MLRFSIIITIISLCVNVSADSIAESCAGRKIKAYVREGCSYCTKLQRLLDHHKIELDKTDISGNRVMNHWLISSTGKYTVPYVFLDGQYIGGYSDFVKLCMRGG